LPDMTDAVPKPKASEKAPNGARPQRPWYMLALLALIYVAGSIDRAVPSVIVEPLKAEFGLSDGQLGFVTGFAYSIPYALAVLPAGWLIDRFHRRVLLSAAAAIWSVLTMAGAAAQNFLTLVLARMGVGVTEAPASPGSLSLIGDLFPKERRTTAISLYYAGTATGQMITFLVGGWLLLQFSWRTLFFVAGVPGIILALLLFFTCREPKRGQYDEGEAKPPVSYRLAFRAIMDSKSLRHAIVGNMLSTGVSYAFLVWTISFLVRIHGVSHEYAAIIVGLCVGLMMMVGSVVTGIFTDRHARGNAARIAQVPALGTSIGAVIGIAMCLMPSLTGALVMFGLFAFFMGINTGPGYTTIVTMTGSNMRGSILSIAKIASVLIGNGGLAFFTGAASDLIGGPESIRWALMLTVFFLFWASFHFTKASRASAHEQAD
jgi:predicted MFS family arabinose efflux permease